jgi:hypothetical protein
MSRNFRAIPPFEMPASRQPGKQRRSATLQTFLKSAKRNADASTVESINFSGFNQLKGLV